MNKQFKIIQIPPPSPPFPIPDKGLIHLLPKFVFLCVVDNAAAQKEHGHPARQHDVQYVETSLLNEKAI